MPLLVKAFNPPVVASNSYIIKDTVSGEAAVIDAGIYNARFEDMLRSMKIEKLRYILLTHGHFDHIMGVKRLQKSYGGEVVIHKADADCLTDSEKSLASVWRFVCPPLEYDRTVEDGDVLTLGEEKIEVIHTPGHTEGSVTYKTGNQLFTGDTLFHVSIGRTDFPGGSMESILSSIKKLYSLEGDYRVSPGHGGESTLSFERDNNPYTRGL